MPGTRTLIGLLAVAVFATGCSATSDSSTEAAGLVSSTTMGTTSSTSTTTASTTSTTATSTTTTSTTTTSTTTTLAPATTTTIPTTTIAAPTTTTTVATTTTTTGATTTTQPSVPGEPSGVLAIGDSVMQAASNKYCGTLPAAIPGLEIYGIEGMVSRQFGAAEGIVAGRISEGQTPRVLIIHLGTNGPVSTSAFDALMAVAASIPKVVFVTIKVPRDYVASSNQVIRSGVGRYGNAVLADWEAASRDHPEYFSNDELFHLNCNPGAKAYAALIAGKV